MPNERKWYYAENKERKGPFEESAFIEIIKSGTLTPESLVWTKGFEKWRRLKNTELACHLEAETPPALDVLEPEATPQSSHIGNQEDKPKITNKMKLAYAGYAIAAILMLTRLFFFGSSDDKPAQTPAEDSSRIKIAFVETADDKLAVTSAGKTSRMKITSTETAWEYLDKEFFLSRSYVSQFNNIGAKLAAYTIFTDYANRGGLILPEEGSDAYKEGLITAQSTNGYVHGFYLYIVDIDTFSLFDEADTPDERAKSENALAMLAGRELLVTKDGEIFWRRAYLSKAFLAHRRNENPRNEKPFEQVKHWPSLGEPTIDSYKAAKDFFRDKLKVDVMEVPELENARKHFRYNIANLQGGGKIAGYEIWTYAPGYSKADDHEYAKEHSSLEYLMYAESNTIRYLVTVDGQIFKQYKFKQNLDEGYYEKFGPSSQSAAQADENTPPSNEEPEPSPAKTAPNIPPDSELLRAWVKGANVNVRRAPSTNSAVDHQAYEDEYTFFVVEKSLIAGAGSPSGWYKIIFLGAYVPDSDTPVSFNYYSTPLYISAGFVDTYELTAEDKEELARYRSGSQ